MVSIAQTQIDLFADTLPDIKALQRLEAVVHSSEANLLAFAEQLEAQSQGAAPALPVGIGLYILGKDRRAIEKLETADDCRQKFLYLALAHRRLGQWDDALECFEKAKKHQAEALMINLEKAQTLRLAGRLDEAQEQLKNCANFDRVSAEYHFQLGRLREAQGLYREAVDNYKLALELENDHTKSLFHLAFACDLRGDEEAAMDYYKQIAAGKQTCVSALLNLAVLYEDREQYERAAQCVDKVLKSHPNHQRAILFRKDIESSKTMVYDEERQKTRDRRNQVLDTPLSDFELSVRSRNCLHKMNIRNLRDLMNTTEAELLAYKNFGETSLTEIKKILDSKGLYLGMALEDTEGGAQTDEDRARAAIESLLSKPVDELPLSVRSRKALERLNIRTLGDITARTEAELLGCKNFGVTSLNEIKQCLSGYGLSLRQLE